MRSRWLPILTVFCLSHFSVEAALSAEPPMTRCDWPGWQGPERNCISHETGLLKTWPKEGPKLLWISDQVGSGLGGIAVSGGRLVVLGTQEHKDCAFGFDAVTGKQLWITELGEVWRDGFGVGPRSTPTMDGDFVYALGGQQANLTCMRADTGEIVWQKNYRKDFKSAFELDYGRCCESPLVDGNKVLCTPGGEEGTIFALDKLTGEILWRSERIEEYPTISSIIVAEICGVRQYIQQTDHNLFGVSEEGALLWRYTHPHSGHLGISIHTPMASGDFVLGTYGGNFGTGDARLFKITRNEGKFDCEKIYSKPGELSWNQHVIVDGYVYGGITGSSCMELATGNIEPLEGDGDLGGSAGVIYADNRFYLLGDGGMQLLEANPKESIVHGIFKVAKKFKSDGFVAPALADRRLYIRDTNMIYCYDLHDPSVPREALQNQKANLQPEAGNLPNGQTQARVDSLGDPLPPNALARIGTLRFRPAEKDVPYTNRYSQNAYPPGNAKLSPGNMNHFDTFSGDAILLNNRKEVLSVHLTDQVYVSDVTTGEVLRQWTGPAEASCLTVSADNKMLAVGSRQGIWFWDISNTPSRLVWKYEANTGGLPTTLVFSPDGKTLAVGTGEPCLLDIANERLLEKKLGTNGVGVRLVFSPDSRLLAICHAGSSRWDSETKIVVFDLAQETKREILNVGNCFLNFAPDSQTLCFVGHVPWKDGGAEGGVNIPLRSPAFLGSWDVATGKETRKELPGVPDQAAFLFHPNGSVFFEVGCGRIRTLDAMTGIDSAPSVEVVDDCGDTNYRLSPDGRSIIHVNGTAVRVRDVQTGAILGPGKESPLGPVQVAFSPDGRCIATADKQTIQVWDSETGGPRCQMKSGQTGRLPQQLSYLSHHPILGTSFNWAARDFIRVANKIGYSSDNQIYAFTALNRKTVFSGWDTRTGKPVVPPVSPFCAGLPPYEFSRSGKLVAVGGDFECSVYDLENGKEVRTISGIEPLVLLTVSPDEKWLLTYSSVRQKDETGIMSQEKSSRSINIWDIASGKQVADFPGFFINCYDDKTVFVNAPVALAPGAKRFAATKLVGKDPHIPDTIQVIDVGSKKVERELTGPKEGITCVLFSPDGRWLAAGCGDATVRVWEVESGKEAFCFAGHQARICSLAFSPDGLRLASGSDDSTALIWDLR